ncbi:substrate-binding periplasmic protein [Pelagibacterium halotolerans]|uniref:ABC-type amino acid transport/signal transduction systems, periplasmic component/domain protein n=1 Tax=Pelagibacterium halotolerans (strain DSM 22347 / JCM 15775 / CGMCC 1.7692 / B2) TaxID=1082931 RepID=G4R9H4_PELHB|nr:transporter substrate-binding domain-containing protein [Pelagibacterium halotolerans]AEQ50394.1 ABC-type amino acid transport/signal transduction systems, periplasmic component/domain protein [Pelagibacterium halotolerans B2]QJR19629.1 transporter substrate-binding domain-containing protein [Pelagibacterium halotolerans]SDZ86188.1 polar amino acid transport system substrate-binding protein [Pelagibacterium halotolerans]
MKKCSAAPASFFRGWFSVVLAGAIATMTAVPVMGQVSNNVDQSLLETWRLATGNTIRFCQYEASPTLEFDRSLAEAAAQQLLVNAEFTVLGSDYGIGGEYAAEDLFVSLTNDCDVMVGMGLAANMYPVEFISTRPYVGFSYVLAVADENIERLEDIEGGKRVGALVGSFGFSALGRYIATLPTDRQLLALPYGDTELMITRLLDGTIAGMVVYGPSLAQFRAENPIEGEILARSLDSRIGANVNIGGVMLARNAYLRTMMDEAISLMIEDGTITALLAEAGLDTIPAQPGGFE